jgi:hypothetical protein
MKRVKIRSVFLAAGAFLLVCIIIAVVLYTRLWTCEQDETFVPAIPASIDYLVITDTQSDACSVVTAKNEIQNIIRPLTRLSNCLDDEMSIHRILFVRHGLQTYTDAVISCRQLIFQDHTPILCLT